MVIAASIAVNMEMKGKAEIAVLSLLKTATVIIWSIFILRLARLLLRAASQTHERFIVVSSQTLPLFENLAILIIIAIAIYFIFNAWNIDMTAWLASAGIIGIAVGFASKDTLANLFSGVFILADAPYKIGDYIVLDVSDPILTAAVSLVETHGVRAYDGVQLAAAIHLNRVRTSGGLSAVTVVSSDHELNAAAHAEALAVEDPNSHR